MTSNIWGTKFKIHGLATCVPANLGQVTYKTSLLHLQPRQMTLVMTELRDDFPVGPDPNFNPNLFSEDEEENVQAEEISKVPRKHIESCPPIAPMTPRRNLLGKQKCSYVQSDQSTKKTGECVKTLFSFPVVQVQTCNYFKINYQLFETINNNV